jgi:hypothetical protein
MQHWDQKIWPVKRGGQFCETFIAMNSSAGTEKIGRYSGRTGFLRVWFRQVSLYMILFAKQKCQWSLML